MVREAKEIQRRGIILIWNGSNIILQLHATILTIPMAVVMPVN